MIDTTPSVDILLATYNGHKYLNEQLVSITRQTFTDWRIIVRDDGSTDETMAILLEWKSRIRDRMEIIDETSNKNLGVVKNFERLLYASRAPFVAFSDQDDIWADNKLELFVRAMTGLETAYGRDRPSLAFSDLCVVNDDLNVVHESFWAYQRMYPEVVNDIRQLALSNCVTGCAMMINRSAIKCSLPFKDAAVMHDWWMALSIAHSHGVFASIREKPIFYRQHASNAVGARSASPIQWVKKFFGYIGDSSELSRCIRQAQAFGLYRNNATFLYRKAMLILRRYAYSIFCGDK